MAAKVVGCLLILWAAGTQPHVSAQSPKPDPNQILRTFRITATEADGQPVTDLRPEEIQVTDDGRRYPLLFARLLRANPPRSPGPGSLDPHKFSNLKPDSFSSSTLILLDLLNANLTERGAAWNETDKTLEALEHAENVFLFLLTPDANLSVVHGWPPPGAPSESPSVPWTRQVRQLLDQSLREVERLKPTDLTAAPGLTAEPTYRALTILARQYAALPGQKRVIWVTHGLPMTATGPAGLVDLTPLLKQTAAVFSQLGIALYTVHQSVDGAVGGEALQSLPPLTGGRWFESDAVGLAVTRARDDARGTYEAGYDSPAKTADGKVHKLRVSTTRKGIRLLAEESYTASMPEEIAQINAELVASRPFDTPDIGLRASMNAGGKLTRLQIYANPRDLFLRRQGSLYTGKLSSTVLYHLSDGSQRSSQPVTTDVRLTQEQLDTAIKDGYEFSADVNLPSGATPFRLIVQDMGTGLTGSLSIPVSAHPPS